MWKNDLERGMIFATGIMIINLLIGFIATIFLASPMTGSFSAGSAFLEMGVLLMIGGCLMSRQPLKDEDRYSDDGSPTSAWKMALFGRQIIFTSVFLFLYAGIVTLITMFYPI